MEFMYSEETAMAKPKVKLRLRRPKPLVILAVAVVLVVSIAALVTVHMAADTAREETQALRGEAFALEQQTGKLELYIEEYGTIRGIIRIAQEKLGLIEPDSIVFEPSGQ